MTDANTDTDIDRRVADPQTYADPGARDAVFGHVRRNDPVRWTAPGRSGQ